MIQLWGPHGQILSINTQKVSHCIVFCYFYLLQSTKWLKSWFRNTLGHSEQDLLMAFVVVNTFWGPQRPILSIPTKKVSYLTVFPELWLLQCTKWLENWYRHTLAHGPQVVLMTFVILRSLLANIGQCSLFRHQKSVVFGGFYSFVASLMDQMTWKLVQIYFNPLSTIFINDFLRFEAVCSHFWPWIHFSRSKNGWSAYLLQVPVTSNKIQSQKFLGQLTDFFLKSNSF